MSRVCEDPLSIQRYEAADGTRWRVRWRESTGRMRSTTVPSKSAAIALDADIKAKKFKGEALPRPSRETLAGAYDEWLRLRADNLAPSSLAVYKSSWHAHIQGTGFDSHRLTELVADPMLLEELTADLRARGVGPAAQRKALVVRQRGPDRRRAVEEDPLQPRSADAEAVSGETAHPPTLPGLGD